MIRVEASVRAVRWPVDWPPGQGGATRVGFTLELIDDAGRIGRGEAAPLPGRSGDDLEAARVGLARIVTMIQRGPIDLDATPLATAARLAADARSVAARWAIEVALLDLIGQRRGVPAAALLSPAPAARLPVAVVVAGAELPALAAAARDACGRGAGAIKLKVGVGPVALDLARLCAVRAAIGPGVELRADANRAWGVADATAVVVAAGGPDLDLAFVEEPCADPHRLAMLPAGRWALDESGLDLDADALAHLLAARPAALVLKPALLGVAAALALAARARAAGVPVIVSHAVDGAIGHAGAAALALALGGTRAAGLGHHAGLDAWTAPVPGLTGAGLTLAGPGLGFTSPPALRPGADGHAA